MEHVQPFHKPWIEVTHTKDIIWEPCQEDRYTGTSRGGQHGLTSAFQTVVRNATTLACIFLFIVPMAFITKVVEFNQADWVVEKTGKERDGKMKKKIYLVGCKEETPGSRHYSDNKKRKYKSHPVSSFVGYIY